jgi:hypothetical protein
MKLYYNIQKLLQVVSIIRSRKERPQLKAERNGVEVSSTALMLPRGHLSDIHLPNNQIADCRYRRAS